MKLKHSLQPFNTFGIAVLADFYDEFSSISELQLLLPEIRKQNTIISGGGSNILFTKDFEGLFLRNRIRGIKEISRTANSILIEVGSGEIWHHFVQYCVQHGYGGIENLSLIPGCVGAAPMQNIGAYGVEIKEVFSYLDAVEIETGNIRRFLLEDCEFGYRESVFKQSLKNKYIIVGVAFNLELSPIVNTKYGIIENELNGMGVTNPTIMDVSKAVIAIRESKLPDPTKLGNAGSFFKNPLINKDVLLNIQKTYPDVPNYPIDNVNVKLAAGWLIEKAGWKGKRTGNCGVHSQQALVLVNYGGASGAEIFQLSEDIITDIYNKFGLSLEREVNIY